MSRARRAVIDGTGPDAEACARLLQADGVVVDRAPDATGDLVVVDCWTSEMAPIVTRHQQAGAEVTSIGELLLTRTRARTIGVTGSGGKTTTTRLIAAMLSASGRRVVTSSTARAGNAWPSADLLDGLPHHPSDVVVLELTSTHLAYMASSPDVAVVTSFWPDHVELHGSVDRYREAKLTLLAHQGHDDTVVVNGGDPGAARFAELARGRVLLANPGGPVRAGVGVEDGEVVANINGRVGLGRFTDIGLPAPLDSLALTAACAALAEGADPAVVMQVLRDRPTLPHRGRRLGVVGGVEVIDSSAATSPRKLVGAIAGLDPARTIVIAGGASELDGIPVLASAPEELELATAVQSLRDVRAVVAFGPAGRRLATEVLGSIELACARAMSLARPGDTVVLAPLFPTSLPERHAFATAFGLESGTTPGG